MLKVALSTQAAVLLQGRVLGGGSTINGLLYSRGNKRDYDTWEALGNPDWGYESVLPYFIKSEDLQNRPPPETGWILLFCLPFVPPPLPPCPA